MGVGIIGGLGQALGSSGNPPSIGTTGNAFSVRSGSANETTGGLNLFKFGSEQANRATDWRTGDYFLSLPNRGTPQLNWNQNYGALRREMRFGNPIFDSYRTPNGNLIPTGGFLNAERQTLINRSWTYNNRMGAWMPPR